VAAAKGPLHALRGTGESEKMLKNAKTEYWNEFEEIATYTAIETLADTVGDKETARLARGIRREEERMAKFLEGQIPQLTKSVAREEIPAAERRTNGSRSRRRGGSARRSRAPSRSRS
jgi:rubrerythrin